MGQPEAMVGTWPNYSGIDSWWTGARFESPILEPVRCILHSNYTEGLLPLFNDQILLMTSELVQCLRDVGVDNIDCYQALVADPITGMEYTNYQAVNVIGVLAIADFSRSLISPGSSERLISVDFDQLALNTERALSLKMFRLAECVTALIVHESVRMLLENRTGFETLQFIEPAKWIG